MHKLSPLLAAAALLGSAGLAQAKDAIQEAEGAAAPHPAVCTFEKAVLCKDASTCEPTDNLGDLPLPARFLFHFEKRIIAATGPGGLPHITTVRALAQAGDSLVMQGVSGPVGWTIQSSMSSGETTFVTASDHTVLTAFGTCKSAESGE